MALAATGLIETLAALALLAQAPSGPAVEGAKAQELRDACGLATAHVVDASADRDIEAVRRKMAANQGQPIILAGAKLEAADMAQIAPLIARGCVIDSALVASDWQSVEIPDLTFIRSDLSKAKLANASLPRVRIIGTSLAQADLSDADLSGGRYAGSYWNSDLSNTDLSGANLTRFVFACGITMDEACNSSGSDFSRAILTEADLSELPSWGGNTFDQAVINQTRLHPRAVANFEGLNVVGNVILSAWAVEDGRATPSATLAPSEFAALKDQALQAATDAPSFDCQAAATPTEKLICGPYESHLRALDRDMAKLWKQARAKGKGSLAQQRKWLRSRAACEDRGCLADKYEARMSELLSALGAQIVLAPDAVREFDGDVLPLPREARVGGVYARLVPVLKSASMQSARLTGLEDGRIRAAGDAIGGNAHMCSLGVDAHYDAASGWYGAAGEDGIFVPLFRVWDDRLFFRYSGNLGDTPDEASNFISCGARAGFSTMIDLAPKR